MGVGLTAEQVVNRATALSCAGCHRPIAFGLTSPNSIGPGQSWPNALAFVHVDMPLQSIANEPGFDITKFGGNSQGFRISEALLDVFLPARRTVLANLANDDVCNCVSNILSVHLPDLHRFPEIPFDPIPPERRIRIDKFGDKLAKNTRAAIRKTENDLLRMDGIRASDLRKAFAKKKQIIRKAEARMEERMRTAGIKLITPSLKPQPVIFADTDKPSVKFKTEALNKLLNSTPPRETITGSFRTH